MQLPLTITIMWSLTQDHRTRDLSCRECKDSLRHHARSINSEHAALCASTSYRDDATFIDHYDNVITCAGSQDTSLVCRECKSGYTLFANCNKTCTKRKFYRKNCKFAKHDENRVTHYSFIIQSFVSVSTFSVLVKNPFEFVMETACLAKQDEPSFAKKIFHETLWNIFYTLFMVRTNFSVSSQFRCGLQIVYSPFKDSLQHCARSINPEHATLCADTHYCDYDNVITCPRSQDTRSGV